MRWPTETGKTPLRRVGRFFRPPGGEMSPIADRRLGLSWLCGDFPLRLGYVDVRKQQIPKFGVFKMV
jgi:hypothetical protein